MCLGRHCFLDSGGARGASPDGRGKVFVSRIFICADFWWRANKISHSYQPRMSGYAPLVNHLSFLAIGIDILVVSSHYTLFSF